MQFFVLDRVIRKEGLYVYDMHNVVEKYLSIGIAPVRNRGGSLVINKWQIFTSL
jgi:hypothetical protein